MLDLFSSFLYFTFHPLPSRHTLLPPATKMLDPQATSAAAAADAPASASASGVQPTVDIENRSRANGNANAEEKDTTTVLLDIDASYDESADPDYTMSNATVYIDEEEEDLGYESDIMDDIANLSGVDDEIIDKMKKSLASGSSASLSSTASTVTLPIHKNFYSLIHKHEIPRKLFHVSIGFITLYLHLKGYKTNKTWQPISIAMSIIFLLDLLRFQWPYFNKLYCATVGFLMREKEVNSINGVIWFQLGAVLTFMFQKQDVSVMSILLLSWSDTAASTIGRAFGHLSPKISKSKSLVGSIAAFFTGVFACYFFYGYITPNYPLVSQGGDFEYDPATNHLNLQALSLLSGLVAAVSEGIDIAGLDDNLTIPLFSGLFLSFVIKLGK